MKSVSIFNVTTVEFSLFLPLSFPPSSCIHVFFMFINHRGASRTAATSKMERFVIIVNGFQPLTNYYKALNLGCCSSPRSASESRNLFHFFLQYKLQKYKELKSSENQCARKKYFSMIHEN